MAAAPGPDEVLHSTPGKANFQRMTRLLIIGGTTLLREIFDIRCPPSDLPRILKNPATKKKLAAAKLTKPQWDCLYPSPGTYGKSEDFDVTLLFRLLRTICNLIPPSTGWDALPASTDHSLVADLIRIKYYRNSVYGHVDKHMEIRDDEFPSLWQEISKALLGIADQINTKKKDEWQKAVDKFLKDPLTAQDERNVQELLCWYRTDTEAKEYIKKLDSSIEKVQDGIKHLETSNEGMIHVIKEKSQQLETTVRKEAQDIKDQLGGEVKTTTEEVQSLRQDFLEEARDIKDQLGGEVKTTTEEVQSLRQEFREEARDIKDQLGGEGKTTNEQVQLLRQEFRAKAQGIKDQLGEVHQSIDKLRSSSGGNQAAGVQLRMRIDCSTIPESCPQGEASGSMVLASHGAQTGGQEMVVPGVKRKAVVPIASSQPQSGVALGVSEVANVETDVVPNIQDLLIMIAARHFKRRDKSNAEKLDDFVEYMERVRKVLIVDAQTGSLIVTVECGSLDILDDLWYDYCTGHLNEMAQKYLVTEDILKEFGLVEVKLSTTIQEEEYRAARECFMQGSGRGVVFVPEDNSTDCHADDQTDDSICRGYGISLVTNPQNINSQTIKCAHHPDALLIEDYRAGDMICSECGLVVGDRVVDVGSEWRTFSNEKATSDPSRVGAAQNPLLGGGDLSTIIERVPVGNSETDGYSKYHNRGGLTGSDRSLMNAFREIGIMADRINLPRKIVDRANQLFKQVHEQKSLKGRSNDAIASACLYIACRQEGVPRTFKEICAISKISKKEIGRCFKLILKALETSVDLITTADFMSRFCSNLGLPPHVQKAATHIARRAVDLDLVPGRSPISVAAAAIYMASQASEEKKSQKEIGDIAGVADVTIRQSYRLIYLRAAELFPSDFKFTTPVDKLPNL